MFSREPIVIINAVGAVLVAVLPLLAVLGVTDLTVEQFGAIEAFIVALTVAVATVFGRSQVTPVADPRLPE